MNVEQQLRNLAAICDRNQHAIHELTARVAELEKKISHDGGSSSDIPTGGKK